MFEEGDRVICIRGERGCLEEGAIYTIDDCFEDDDDEEMVYLVEVEDSWCANRFEHYIYKPNKPNNILW